MGTEPNGSTSSGVSAKAEGVRALLGPLMRVEFAYTLLLACTFLLPNWIGYRAWIPALALTIVFAAAHGLLSGRRPLLPAFMFAYLGAYLLAGLHSDPDTFSWIEAGKYFAPPVLALAVAWSSQDAEVRRNLLLLALAFVALQFLVAVVQTVETVAEHGRGSIEGADSVVGFLGPGHPGTLTQIGLVAGFLLFAAWLTGALRGRVALAAVAALISLGVLSSTRAAYLFVPLGLAAIAALSWLLMRRTAPRRDLWIATAAVFLSFPLLYLALGALYPGANDPFKSVGDLETTLKSAPATAARQQAQGNAERATTVLPGRAAQLELALELSVDDGPLTALVGRGLGATRFKQQSVLNETGPTQDPIVREEQRTNGVWVPRLISETGYLGLLAFLGLLVYMLVLTWRNREMLRTPSWDAAVIASLPGTAALTAVSAGFNTILAIQPYVTLFWPLIGIAIAIDAARRKGEVELRTGPGNEPRTTPS